MKKIISILTVFAVVFTLVGCSSEKDFSTAEKIVSKLKETDNLKEYLKDEETFDKKSDPNKLMGQENAYISKTSFKDTRVAADYYEESRQSVEVFKNEEDAKIRKDKIEYSNKRVKELYGEEVLGKFSSEFVGYLTTDVYQYKNVVLMLEPGLSEKTREEYKKELRSLLADYDYEQKDVPDAKKIESIMKTNHEKTEVALADYKEEVALSIAEVTKPIDEKLVKLETNLSETSIVSLETEIEDFNVPYFADKYNEWKARIENVKTTIANNKAAEEAAKEAEFAARERTFTTGNYTVGVDIDPGKYDIIAVSGTGVVTIQRSGTSGNSVIEMIGINNKHYIESFSNATIAYGQVIEITGGVTLTFKPKK